MALGKKIGEFSLQPTSITYEPHAGTVMKAHMNLAGTASGDQGEWQLSLTHYVEGEVGAKSGTWQQYGFASFPDGGGVSIQGSGTWEETGPNAWRYRGTGRDSAGTMVGLEFEGSMATGTWAGSIHEWN